MAAVLFGSISTIADTSELQREAFNAAFEKHGLDWRWDREDYIAMLAESGGRNRIAAYAQSRGENVDADAVHETKSEIFQQSIAGSSLTPRPGVVETVHGAKDGGAKVALVTTTARANIDALLGALAPELQASDFDLVVDASTVSEPKPDKAAYGYALTHLGEEPGRCVAIEDNVGGVAAAVAAGLPAIAFPNANTASHDFGAARQQVEKLDADDIRSSYLGG